MLNKNTISRLSGEGTQWRHSFIVEHLLYCSHVKSRSRDHLLLNLLGGLPGYAEIDRCSIKGLGWAVEDK